MISTRPYVTRYFVDVEQEIPSSRSVDSDPSYGSVHQERRLPLFD